MKYNSVPEYFYKLYSRLYALVLIPLLSFVALYWKMKTGDIKGLSQDTGFNYLLLLIIIVIVLADWIVAFFIFRKNLKSILTLGSLGSGWTVIIVLRFFGFQLLYPDRSCWQSVFT